MGIFDLFKKQEPVPEWANFFSSKEYKRFIESIKDYFKHDFVLHEEEGIVTINGSEAQYGLLNLAHICKQNQEEHWKEIVYMHFNELIESEKFFESFSKQSHSLDYAGEYIATRLYHLDHIEKIGIENAICEKINDDLYQTLVYDFPHTIHTVKKEDSLPWNKTKEELFYLGRKNIKNKYEIEIAHQDMGDFKIWILADSQGFASNILLDPEDLKPYLGNYGALVGVPNVNLTLIYPIDSLEVARSLHTLAVMIEGESAKAKSLSDKLYWYRDGNMIEIPFKIVDKKITISPPEEFVEMLNGLKSP